MLEFLLQKGAVKSAQKFIDRLDPKVSLHVPEELPMPSIGELKRLSSTVSQINGMENEIERLSDDDLRAKTAQYRQRYLDALKKDKEEIRKLEHDYHVIKDYQEKDTINIKIEKLTEDYKKKKQDLLLEILPEAFAVVREAGKRVLNMRHYDVQMVGGMVLNAGNIAEMTTGEGKTLVATLPTYLNAITGEGVHVVTVNDYLARRDREWMGPLFEFLGLTVGVILHDMNHEQRKQAYGCDITYGTNNEFGFDYLRDNMVNFKEEMVQRGHHFSVVDEVDSILVDEARTPLIISGPAEASTDKYYKAYEISKKVKGRRVTERDEITAKHKEEDLTIGFDYLADEKNKSIALTDPGEEKIAQMFGIDNLHDMESIEYRHHILQALKAKEFFKADVDYVVRDGEVIIVDEFTGRLMPGRRWSDGLHQAVEAQEGMKIERENQTLASITFQNYFRMYEKLSGMTGTAYTEASEFKQIYELDTIVTPTNKPLQRMNYPDSIYRSFKEKMNAVVEEIKECHGRGQPVLVGTISIEKSELVSKMLKQQGIPHNVLNAKYHEMEANIIAQAGRYKAVTIATNMAGRGTDIVLGGNPEFLAESLANEKLKEEKDEDQKEQMVQKFIDQFKTTCKEEQVKVLAEGGLYVMGTERHESRRIDNQLRGRQGRQGDPGASRFYVSLEDDLMRLFASERIIGLMDKLGMEEGQVLEHPWLNKALENAQKRVEGHNFEIRKHLLEYDNVMNRQREVIYDLRRFILESTDVKHLVVEAIEEMIEAVVAQHLFSPSEGEEETWDIEGLEAYLKAKFLYDIAPHKDKLKDMPQQEVNELLRREMVRHYGAKEEQIPPEHLRQMERMLLLHTIDSKWKDHLYAMDQLKEGIGLRGYGQRDPLIEFKREGFGMFELMYSSVNQEVAEIIFKVQPSGASRMKGVFSSVPQNMVHQQTSALGGPSAQGRPAAAPPPAVPGMPAPSRQSAASSPASQGGEKVGRNDPCPCGSGKKYKKCCGQ